ncbi:hypothetical protein LZ480_19600 [Solibacillus sp. MA9]|uniref:Uncharacterized protein n=1 Tax=Solibacillus palustris TaxID=2908203 RepID=A0ABS9UIA2_9BACL|nr:hypothetical protein [Solibacillus sp. MA9]MCH7324066.1 hypothetical protein [Solibacillus sp. MA9]
MKRVLNILLAIIVIVVGFYFVINFKPPKPSITIENKKVEVIQGSYCWGGLIYGQCVDKISPPDMILHKKLKPVVVSPGAKLKIEFNREPHENSLYLSVWMDNDELEDVLLKDNTYLVSKEKGIYVYSVSAHWKKGSSSYNFLVEVK